MTNNRAFPRLAAAILLTIAAFLETSALTWAQTVTTTITVGTEPTGVAVNPITNRVYVTNQGSDSVSVIDGGTNSLRSTISVGRLPQGVAVNATTNRIYVANTGADTVSVIDGAANRVIDTISVGSAPEGVALDPSTNRIYVADAFANAVSVIDGANNAVVATVPVGTGPTHLAVNPTTDRIYVANTGSQAAGVGHTVSVLDGTSNTVIATVSVGTFPSGVAVNSSTNRIYVANFLQQPIVSAIDGANLAVIATAPVGFDPRDVAIDPVKNRVYVANQVGGTVSVIDATTNTTIATIPVETSSQLQSEGGPQGIAVNPTTGLVYVTSGRNTISVIQESAATSSPAQLPKTGEPALPTSSALGGGLLLLLLGLGARWGSHPGRERSHVRREQDRADSRGKCHQVQSAGETPAVAEPAFFWGEARKPPGRTGTALDVPLA